MAFSHLDFKLALRDSKLVKLLLCAKCLQILSQPKNIVTITYWTQLEVGITCLENTREHKRML